MSDLRLDRLQEETSLFHLLVDSVQDYAIFALDADGHIASWNRGAEKIKGYSAAEVIGRHFSLFYTEEAREAGRPAANLRAAAAEGRVEDEGWRVRKDGARFWASVVITALRSADGELLGFAKVTRDLTERKQAEAQAIELVREQAARSAAEQANRSKSEFLAAMSHDLRTPLNAIFGHADLIDLGVHGPVTEAQHEALDRIKRNQRVLLALVNDVLNFARLEAGKLELHVSDVAIDRLASDLEAMIGPQLHEKGLTYTCCAGASGAQVRGDPERIEQILLNLLSNAVKFTPGGGSVTLSIRAEPHDVRLSVRDTGPGIPPDRQESIFDPFVQIDREPAHPASGVGLGLAISRDLARAMGGTLSVESTPGEGSTFTLTLPRGNDA
ncbi:MAG TPA: ATP-binding protein [Longimicrobiaceae bacterium]|nr:ATP-binding protein [Longimicrobiaceae bacterium]